MKKLILFSVLTVCVLCTHAQVSKLSEEVAMGDQQYLMGNIKEANKAYKRASKTKDLSAKILAYYRMWELSAITGSESESAYIKAYTEAATKGFFKKMGTPNMTKDEFYAQNNIQPLHQMSLQANNVPSVSQQANVVLSQTNNQPNVQVEKPKSDVDIEIPIIKKSLGEKTFVVIIANENYQEVAKVPYTINDGEIFAEYCKKTLGIPETNISLVKDATANNMKREVRWLTQILQQYNGEAKAIVYYAGHGIPDESTKDAYLLPVDGYGDDPSTGYSLNELYKTLNEVPSKSTLVFLDACFSGANRDGSMLASARGVAIKAKPTAPIGNMVVFSAAQGDETAYPYKDKGHGLFTYYFLKKLQETKGDVTLGELSEYITDQVGKQSIVINRKSQTPNVSVSSSLQEDWKKIKIQ
jgi:hypothetical protein